MTWYERWWHKFLQALKHWLKHHHTCDKIGSVDFVIE